MTTMTMTSKSSTTPINGNLSDHESMDEDLMDQVDTLIDDLAKAQVASERTTTPGGRYTEDQLTVRSGSV